MLLTESGHGTTVLAGRPRTGRGGPCLCKSEQWLLRACVDGLGRRAGGFFRVTRHSSTPWGGGYMRGSFHQTVGFGSAQVPAATWVVGVCGSVRPSQVPRGRRQPKRLPPEVLAVMFRCHHFRVIKFCGQDTESRGLRQLCARHASAGCCGPRWRDHPEGSGTRDPVKTRGREWGKPLGGSPGEGFVLTATLHPFCFKHHASQGD